MNLLGSQQVPKYQSPTLGNKSHDNKRWSFSFRYWEQVEYFGVGEASSSWFVSLLERLQEFSKLDISQFLSDGTARNAWRYHEINWNQKNIPVQRYDLTWVDSVYLDNPDEYPIVQFQVSQALGRVVGFFDEHLIFNILLLDRMHNIQPSKSHGYKVDKTAILSCDYSALLLKLQTIKKTLIKETDIEAFDNILQQQIYANVVIHYISDEDVEKCDQLIESGVVDSISEIFKYGIHLFEDSAKT